MRHAVHPPKPFPYRSLPPQRLLPPRRHPASIPPPSHRHCQPPTATTLLQVPPSTHHAAPQSHRRLSLARRPAQSPPRSTMRHSPPRKSPSRACLRAPAGAPLGGVWAPQDVWDRIASSLFPMSAQKAFAHTCASAAAAVHRARAPARADVRNAFRLRRFSLPHDVIENVLMVHIVPPHGAGLVMLVDESDGGGGVVLAWLTRGRVRRVALGLEAVPATAISNIRFSPDGSSVALLVTLSHGGVTSPEADPLRRLRGWSSTRVSHGTVFDIEYDPCEDCTVQVIDLCDDEDGFPNDLVVHTFSHVFVPEYGFDMVWRQYHQDGTRHQELAFAAMLHSDSGAATYLVRWKTFRNPDDDNFIFMACIDGASMEFVLDKKDAMMTHKNTVCTSRIEIANDAKHIFFDTVSKFGILRFDQVDDASASRVTRADLRNYPAAQPWVTFLGRKPQSPYEFTPTLPKREDMDTVNATLPTFGENCELSQGFISGYKRISRMSPDGSLLCSIVSTCQLTEREDSNIRLFKHIEMRCSATGKLIYRRVLVRPPDPTINVRRIRVQLEKPCDIAQHTLVFSEDSSLLLVWDTALTSTHCVVIQRLPAVLDAKTGSLIQDFGPLSSHSSYECLQISPDLQTIYGTRMEDDMITMDAIDVLSGNLLRTVAITGRVFSPRQFSTHAIYLLPNHCVHTVSRGNMDMLWETTRGSLGCGWNSQPRV